MFDMVNKYQKLVRRIIRKKTGGVNPDLEQQVFIRLWQKRETYREQGKEKSWVCVITNNICTDYFKSKFFIHERNASEIPENLADGMPNPEDMYYVVQRQKIVLRAVNKLPKKLKQVIVLQEFEGYSQDEIAQRLKIPVGTVKSRIFTARQKLADELKFLL